MDYQRINVVGTSGSGKTTFCKSLSAILKIDHIEIDKVFWRPNWQMPPDEEFFTSLRGALATKNAWILDGNYTRTIPIKWEKVELVIWLDYSFPRTLLQALKRAIYRSTTGKELWEGTGNRETFRKSLFSKDSIILWTIMTHKKVRKMYESLMKNNSYSRIKFIRLRSPSKADKFLNRIDSHT
jgi:adenylate kinase family enzyme